MKWLRGFNVIKADSFLIEKLKDGTDLKYLPEYTWISRMPGAITGDSDKKTISEYEGYDEINNIWNRIHHCFIIQL